MWEIILKAARLSDEILIIDSIKKTVCFSKLDIIMNTAVQQQTESNGQSIITPNERRLVMDKLY